mmetsp:Transcript_60495/g.124515  ORF Transcript_60495/g.124515 Transcript_60495/m.124515 type:complete len:259 (+) Transcript_60495:78-854(+)
MMWLVVRWWWLEQVSWMKMMWTGGWLWLMRTWLLKLSWLTMWLSAVPWLKMLSQGRAFSRRRCDASPKCRNAHRSKYSLPRHPLSRASCNLRCPDNCWAGRSASSGTEVPCHQAGEILQMCLLSACHLDLPFAAQSKADLARRGAIEDLSSQHCLPLTRALGYPPLPPDRVPGQAQTASVRWIESNRSHCALLKESCRHYLSALHRTSTGGLQRWPLCPNGRNPCRKPVSHQHKYRSCIQLHIFDQLLCRHRCTRDHG